MKNNIYGIIGITLFSISIYPIILFTIDIIKDIKYEKEYKEYVKKNNKLDFWEHF